MTRVSAIMPATDGRSTVDQCLAALRAAAAAPEEVIVVRGPAGTGAAAARNIGAGGAAGELLVFVDSDVEIHSDAILLLREAFERDPDLVAVFGAYDDAPADGGLVSRFRNLLHHHVHSTSAGQVASFWTGLGAVRREAFVSAGGFDPALAYMEDVDLGLRLAQAGGRVLLDPAIRGTHLKRYRLTGSVHTDLWQRAVPWLLLLVRHRTFPAALNLGWRHRLSALTTLGAVGGTAALRPLIAAATLGVFVALNLRFYLLLARQGGAGLALAGIPLHLLHHLTALAALPIALLTVLPTRPERRRRRLAADASALPLPAPIPVMAASPVAVAAPPIEPGVPR